MRTVRHNDFRAAKIKRFYAVEVYKEVKQLEDKLAHLNELSNAADSAKISHKKSLLGKGKVIVSTEDFEKIEAEKKAAAVQQEIARQQAEKAAEAERNNLDHAEHLAARKAEISETEQFLETKLRYAEKRRLEAEELYNRQININKILDKTEKERDIYKRETERIPYLQLEIQDLKINAEKWRTECSTKNGEIAALNAEITEQTKKINYLQKLYNWVYDIAKYACQKLKIDVDRAIQKRSDGYRTTYIFGDEKKRSR